MHASVVIPVWNGAAVILDCLQALYQNSAEALLEVICVDNASGDDSAGLIAQHYPQVILCRQSANLGFAGGVNTGMKIAQGDIFVLLNQDCLVQPGWLDHILAAFTEYTHWGIAGCTLLTAEGEIEHTGAFLRYPEIQGVHLTESEATTPQSVNYVTGALFAIRRALWEQIGAFDEGFHPAYYEETDYCYRARHAGYEIGVVPQSRAIHLRSNHEWQKDTLLSALNQELSRYRFVVKHLSEDEILAFAAYEKDAITQTRYFDKTVGHALAARKTLRGLSEILARREEDLGLVSSQQRYRLCQTTFRQIMHRAILTAQRLSLSSLLEQSEEAQLHYDEETSATADVLALLEPDHPYSAFRQDLPHLDLHDQSWQKQRTHTLISPALMTADDMQARLQSLRDQEYQLIQKIYFRPPQSAAPETRWRRLGRYLLRVLSFVSGREFVLQSQLNTVHTARMDELQEVVARQQQAILVLNESNNALVQLVYDQETGVAYPYHVVQEMLRTLNERLETSSTQQLRTVKQLHRRLQLLELLTDYDYR